MELVVKRLAQPLVHVLSHTPLGVCARLMLQHRIRHLPVLEESGRPVGMVEDLHVFRHGGLLGPALEVWLAFDPESDRLRAGDVAIPFASRCAVGSSTLGALQELSGSDGNVVGVLDDEGHLVGLFTEHDAVRVARDLVEPEHVVGDYASRPARTVDWLMPAYQALHTMLSSGFRHLVVTDGEALKGVVSLRDLVAAGVSERHDWVVFDVQRSGPVYQATLTEPLRTAAGRMVLEHIGCLPVVEKGAVVGIITRSDLMRSAVDALQGSTSYASQAQRAMPLTDQ